MKSEIQLYVENSYHESIERTCLQIVDYLKHNPEAIDMVKGIKMFEDPKLKGLDWSTVDTAQIKDDKLILTLKE